MQAAAVAVALLLTGVVAADRLGLDDEEPAAKPAVVATFAPTIVAPTLVQDAALIEGEAPTIAAAAPAETGAGAAPAAENAEEPAAEQDAATDSVVEETSEGADAAPAARAAEDDLGETANTETSADSIMAAQAPSVAQASPAPTETPPPTATSTAEPSPTHPPSATAATVPPAPAEEDRTDQSRLSGWRWVQLALFALLLMLVATVAALQRLRGRFSG
jgi:hypothetical protein